MEIGGFGQGKSLGVEEGWVGGRYSWEALLPLIL